MEIALNEALDKEVYRDFHETIIGGANFGEKILKDHPKINLVNHEEYIDEYYQTHKTDLDKTVIETEKRYKDIKTPLFAELNRYFGQDFSKENYTCFLSIFDCNPRYLDTKTFQVFYKRSYDLRKEVIAHELTHFAFYDFCFALGLKESSELWELSEIFNVIFLNLPAIQKVIGMEELLFYPALKEKLTKIKTLFAKNLTAEEFIRTSMGELAGHHSNDSKL